MWKPASRFLGIFASKAILRHSKIRLEAERVRRQEALGRVIGHLAHRMNTPLAALRIAEDLMARGDGPTVSEGSWQTVRSVSDDLVELGRLLLELAPGSALRPGRQNLVELVRNACSEAEHRFGTPLPAPVLDDERTNGPGRESFDVALDPRAFDAIFDPAIENAFEAMKAAGVAPGSDHHALGLALRRSCVDRRFLRRHPAAKAGRFVVLVIEDSGDGMSPAVQVRAFDPFFSTRGPHRSGLGLTRLQATVARHGGFVLLSSQPGSGTTVEIFLPELAAD